MAKAKIGGKDVVGVETVEYAFEPFKYSVEPRPKKTPAVVRGAPQLRAIRVSGIVSTDKVEDVQAFEDIKEPTSFSSTVVSLSKCIVKRVRFSQTGNEPVSYSIEIQEVDEFIEVDSSD